MQHPRAHTSLWNSPLPSPSCIWRWRAGPRTLSRGRRTRTTHAAARPVGSRCAAGAAWKGAGCLAIYRVGLGGRGQGSVPQQIEHSAQGAPRSQPDSPARSTQPMRGHSTCARHKAICSQLTQARRRVLVTTLALPCACYMLLGYPKITQKGTTHAQLPNYLTKTPPIQLRRVPPQQAKGKGLPWRGTRRTTRSPR